MPQWLDAMEDLCAKLSDSVWCLAQFKFAMYEEHLPSYEEENQ